MSDWETTFRESWSYQASRTLDENAQGHSWQRDALVFPDGYVSVDMFAYEGGTYCNGPRCESCGFAFCQHCQTIGPCGRPVDGLIEKLSEIERMKR